jgi:hypothetical protein
MISPQATIGTVGKARVVFAGRWPSPKAHTMPGHLRFESPWTILHNF